MDRLLYTAMSGAQHAMMAQGIRANNLANANTQGFRADYEQASARFLEGDGLHTRALAQSLPAGTNLAAGPLQQTGRDLDIAIQGDGFIAVQSGENEAYTRAGNMLVSPEGELTINGHPVVGEGGALVLPEFSQLEIGSDGTVSLTPPGGGAQIEGGRIKLVRPEDGQLKKGLDGLFYADQPEPLAMDENIVLKQGYLEGANVNVVEEMVQTMALGRQFELQVRAMKTADDQARAGARLIRGS
ncbi:lateral flagellar basal-body rod protein LfgF [Oceanimonas sp. GK1]|uniref:flagellar basal-body rod protein FlgF n=1 Tax=Oceanimonas sp. (strain GK1 / IBRC-M 10197) TaxID=511062 RepID=UPI000249568C|nr:flagellar basal-body rod protein FlgF [Oceanimonas sp. GK1]AEY02555.1 lateral flagellar basal-body rod protein LfgF [Oceanimonas sp. GK1]